MYLFIQDRNDYKLQNSNYKKDITYITKHSKWILNSIGVWPTLLQGVARFLPKIAIVLGNFVLLFAIIPCLLYIIFDEKNTLKRLQLFGLISFCSTSLLKYWALTLRKSKIKDCIGQVQTDWRQVSRLIKKCKLIEWKLEDIEIKYKLLETICRIYDFEIVNFMKMKMASV